MNKKNNQANLLKSVYNQYTNLLNSDGEEVVYWGEINPKNETEFIVYFFDWWVEIIDERLDSVEQYSDEYADILGTRGMTIGEFKQVLSGRSKNYFDKRFYEWLWITDEQSHEQFISKNTYSEEGLIDAYTDLMMESCKNEIPLLYQFFYKTKVDLYLPLSAMKKHTYILGASGSGKSEIIKNLWYDLQKKSHAKNNKTLIALEPSGKLIRELLQIHLNAENKKRVVYLDTNIRKTALILLGEDIFKDDYVFKLNPFFLKNKSLENINYMTPALSSAVFELMKEETKKGQMGNLIKACVDLLLTMDRTSFKDLRDMNDDKTPSKYMRHIKSMENLTRKEFLETKLHSPKMVTSKNGVYQRVHDIIDDYYLTRAFIGENTVDLEKEMNSGKIILFNPTSLQKQSIQVYGKLLVCLIEGYITKRKDWVSKKPTQTFMFIDEAQNYITPSIEAIMAESRKNELHMVLANQVLGQKMTKEVRRIILGNTAIKVAGENEPDTLKTMALQMGGMKVSEFDKLPKYQFFVHNRDNKKAGHKMFKSSSNLVSVKPPYYMDKKKLREFFEWTVYESGYYIKAEEETDRNKTSFESINKSEKTGNQYIPTWEKNEEK